MTDETNEGERWARNLTTVGAVGCGDDDPLDEVRRLLREHSKLEAELAEALGMYDRVVQQKKDERASNQKLREENARLRAEVERLWGDLYRAYTEGFDGEPEKPKALEETDD